MISPEQTPARLSPPRPALGIIEQMRKTLRGLLRRAGWVLHRWPSHRFDAMEDVLLLLHRGGYRPQVIIDVGANVGAWTAMADAVFSAREYHLIEPSPGCRAALTRFLPPRFNVHQVAVTVDGVSRARLAGTGRLAASTGAWLVPLDAGDESLPEVPATTLDALLAGRCGVGERTLLKLDVEGHELAVLSAATRVLELSEVVITEFKLFQFDGGSGGVVFGELLAFMREHDFVLYDFAALASRPRDLRLYMGDAVFVRSTSPLNADRAGQ